MNTNDHPRDPSVSNFLKNKQREVHSTALRNHDDRGIATLLEGYTTIEKLSSIIQAGFILHNNTKGLCYSAAFAWSHSSLLRGDNVRGMDLANMFSLQLDDESSDSGRPMLALCTTIMESKTNNTGRKDYSASLRHLDVECCPIAWIALYHFARWDVDLGAREPFPNFQTSADWFNIKVNWHLSLLNK